MDSSSRLGTGVFWLVILGHFGIFRASASTLDIEGLVADATGGSFSAAMCSTEFGRNVMGSFSGFSVGGGMSYNIGIGPMSVNVGGGCEYVAFYERPHLNRMEGQKFCFPQLGASVSAAKSSPVSAQATFSIIYGCPKVDDYSGGFFSYGAGGARLNVGIQYEGVLQAVFGPAKFKDYVKDFGKVTGRMRQAMADLQKNDFAAHAVMTANKSRGSAGILLNSQKLYLSRMEYILGELEALRDQMDIAHAKNMHERKETKDFFVAKSQELLTEIEILRRGALHKIPDEKQDFLKEWLLPPKTEGFEKKYDQLFGGGYGTYQGKMTFPPVTPHLESYYYSMIKGKMTGGMVNPGLGMLSPGVPFRIHIPSPKNCDSKSVTMAAHCQAVSDFNSVAKDAKLLLDKALKITEKVQADQESVKRGSGLAEAKALTGCNSISINMDKLAKGVMTKLSSAATALGGGGVGKVLTSIGPHEISRMEAGGGVAHYMQIGERKTFTTPAILRKLAESMKKGCGSSPAPQPPDAPLVDLGTSHKKLVNGELPAAHLPPEFAVREKLFPKESILSQENGIKTVPLDVRSLMANPEPSKITVQPQSWNDYAKVDGLKFSNPKILKKAIVTETIESYKMVPESSFGRTWDLAGARPKQELKLKLEPVFNGKRYPELDTVRPYYLKGLMEK